MPTAKAAALELWLQARERRLAMASLGSARAAIEAAAASRHPSTLGARVARLRVLAGVSRRQLSEEAGVPVPTLRRLEAERAATSSHAVALEAWMRSARPENGIYP